MSNKNFPHCFFYSSKNQTSCTSVCSFLQTGTWNLFNYFGCFLNFSPVFQNIEAALERCSTKVFVQQNNVMKHSSAAPMVKSRKVLHANLLKIELHRNYFSKNLTSRSEQRYWKIYFDSCFRRQLLFENIPEWLFLKTAVKIYSFWKFWLFYQSPWLHVFYISFRDVMLKRNEFLWVFFI